MIYLSNWFPLKMLMVTIVSLYLLLAISSSMAYMGTRYGKRESELNRLQARSIGQRSIANRGARFYPGSRYGGKRSYWQPTPFVPADEELVNEKEKYKSISDELTDVPFSDLTGY